MQGCISFFEHEHLLLLGLETSPLSLCNRFQRMACITRLDSPMHSQTGNTSTEHTSPISASSSPISVIKHVGSSTFTRKILSQQKQESNCTTVTIVCIAS